VQQGGAMALEALSHHIRERQEALMRQSLSPGRRQLRCALKRQRVGHVTLGTAGGLRVSPPHVRQAPPLVHEGSPRP
jgi:hypothetical protein